MPIFSVGAVLEKSLITVILDLRYLGRGIILLVFGKVIVSGVMLVVYSPNRRVNGVF